MRLYRLKYAPKWFTDEATHLEIAQQLLIGKTGYFAITDSFLLFARLPLFEWLLAVALRIFPAGMLTLRILSAVLGCLTVAVVYLLVQEALDKHSALLAAGMLSVYPQAVLYSRFGFSYGLTALLLLLIIYGIVNKRFWWLSALALGLGLITEVWGLTIVVPFVVAFGLWLRPKLPAALLIVAAPPLFYTLWMLASAPTAFLFDLQYTASRLGGAPLGDQLDILQTNLSVLARTEPLFGLGCVGIFFLPPKLRAIVALFLFMPLLSLGRGIALFSLSSYYMVPLWPLLAIAAAGLLRPVRRMARQRQTVRWLFKGVTALCFCLLVLSLLQQIRRGFPSGIEPFLVDGQAAEAAADFVNSRVSSAEITLASPSIGHLVKGNVADFQMVPAYKGLATPHLPANLPHNRFAFAPSYEAAHFVIIDPLWHSWAAIHVPNTQARIEEIQSDWNIVFEQHGIQIYKNPSAFQ